MRNDLELGLCSTAKSYFSALTIPLKARVICPRSESDGSRDCGVERTA